ncbi:LvrA [Legionella pneumophila subsp. pneumophila LPE509]|nr:LvrA [Legionella pneumophila subsp. pneumophila LPE509]
MDVKTGLVGIKRGISYQSIAEQLYIEPHQGIKSGSYSRMQIRRALSALGRAGLITPQSEGLKLILRCELATMGYSVQNKLDLNQTQQLDPAKNQQRLINTGLSKTDPLKAGIDKSPKADTPLKEDNYYIFLLSQFEKFWDLYPLKKSKQKAWEAFQALNLTPELPIQIYSALQQQIQFYQQQHSQGQWVAAWKYPANWLAQHCWEDEIQSDTCQETNNAVHETNYKKQPIRDSFWESCKSGIEEETDDNIIDLSAYRGRSQAH